MFEHTSKTPHFILDGKTPIPEPDELRAWHWHLENDPYGREVKHTFVDHYEVRTLFNGFNYHKENGLFVTTIHQPDIEGALYVDHLANTWNEALKQHYRAITVAEKYGTH